MPVMPSHKEESKPELATLSAKGPNGGIGGGIAAVTKEEEQTAPCQALRFAVICASNMNRSMSAHKALKEASLSVESYGVGSHVKLPGPSIRQPNIYNFGTPYSAIHQDLSKKDKELYTRTGLLQMLSRNMGVKTAPERWQETKERFDVVVTFEERVMEAVVEHLSLQPCTLLQAVLVVNLDVKDNTEEAAIAAPQALRLCLMLQAIANLADGSWEVGLEDVLTCFEKETGRRPLYCICWY